MSQETEHITQMEKQLTQQLMWLNVMEQQVRLGFEQLTRAEELFAYYGSQQWREHLALDEAGKLPSGLKRGVLSEDGIYNALLDYKELAEDLIALGQQMQEVLAKTADHA
ncbi:DUF4298 domain-containing protein [Streptococcus entericus]|uniref:DUF4298 domain-containing protein n=1 Tax=Streptococcus entericus TaxID=155680 RepID=UPI0003686751|nr:DUF4298 domain-containing protein [Streptococcus entericus]